MIFFKGVDLRGSTTADDATGTTRIYKARMKLKSQLQDNTQDHQEEEPKDRRPTHSYNRENPRTPSHQLWINVQPMLLTQMGVAMNDWDRLLVLHRSKKFMQPPRQ